MTEQKETKKKFKFTFRLDWRTSPKQICGIVIFGTIGAATIGWLIGGPVLAFEFGKDILKIALISSVVGAIGTWLAILTGVAEKTDAIIEKFNNR